MATLLENFRNALIAAGVDVRDPREAAEGKHPLWLEPRGGAIAPGESAGVEDDLELVLSAQQMPGLGTGSWEGDTYRFDNVEVRFRAMRPPDTYALEKEMREVLHDRRNWDMGEMRIIESLIFLELTPIANDPQQGFTHKIEYSFQHYLTDQPDE